MPVHTHGSLGGGGRKVFGQLVWGGVPERHPRIKLAWTEQGADWIPPMLDEQDALYEQPSHAEARRHLPLKPSEYWARNCWVGHSTRHAPADWELRDRIGVTRMMWGNDFPHPEGIWPYTREKLRECFAEIPEEDRRRLLAGNAAELYDIDLARLDPVVERIGPTAEDIHG